MLLAALTVLMAAPVAAGDWVEPEPVRARVLRVEPHPDPGSLPSWARDAGAYLVTVRVAEGDLAGQELDIMHLLTGNPAYDIHPQVGDRVFVGIELQGGQPVDAYVMDHVRDLPLLGLAALFLVALVVVGGVRGAKAAVVLGLTGLAVAYALIPAILAGHSPILVTVLVSAAVVSFGMALIAGLSRKALAAAAGTVAGVVVAGIVAAGFGRLAHLAGLSGQEAQMLLFSPGLDLDFRGLLFAGMILGALGATMDVGMSIASAVEEVRGARPDSSFSQLAGAGLNVGRDVIGTMANTLILAYAGGALPLLLLLSANQMGLVAIANLDLVATEVVRALSGSLGLVLCVPVTAVVAARLAVRSSGMR